MTLHHENLDGASKSNLLMGHLDHTLGHSCLVGLGWRLGSGSLHTLPDAWESLF